MSQLSILDLLTRATVSQDLCMGLLCGACVCAWGCVCKSVPAWCVRLAGPFFSSILSVVLQCGREWKTATCIRWYDILPQPPPPTVNQQAVWILMEPVCPASVLALVFSQQPVVPGIALTWFFVFLHKFCMISVTCINQRAVFSVVMLHVVLIMVLGCSESCISCMLGQQWEVCRVCFFLSVYGAWAWRDKRLAQDKPVICVYTFF